LQENWKIEKQNPGPDLRRLGNRRACLVEATQEKTGFETGSLKGVRTENSREDHQQ
jgi:hypothetical protein